MLLEKKYKRRKQTGNNRTTTTTTDDMHSRKNQCQENKAIERAQIYNRKKRSQWHICDNLLTGRRQSTESKLTNKIKKIKSKKR
jgi:hypothetical protein